VENLRLYLESEEIKVAANGGKYLPNGDETQQTPLYLSRRFAYHGDRNNIYPSGGAGYTFNKAAPKLLVVNGYPNYFPDEVTFAEDWMLGRIFQKMGVFAYDTQDENGEERFNPFTVSYIFLLSVCFAFLLHSHVIRFHFIAHSPASITAITPYRGTRISQSALNMELITVQREAFRFIT
jgi:hypothetical protein